MTPSPPPAKARRSPDGQASTRDPPDDEPHRLLQAARARIDALDDELVRIAAARVAAALDAGRAKAMLGQGLVDFRREAEVRQRIDAAARLHGLDPAVAQDVVTRLILAATSQQEQERVVAGGQGQGRQAVVVGGAGRMGAWLARFLRSSGYDVLVLDPKAPTQAAAAQDALGQADLVLVAVPPSQAAALYDAWCARPPTGVVADVCSVKGPILPALRRLAAAGACVGSFHPMFGPDATVLRGRDVVVCRAGDARAEATLRGLFAPTTARVVEVEIAEHDAHMAQVLSLAHAAAIAVAATLPAAPPAQSATYRRLRSLAGDVVRENPQVYYEIQAGNPHSLPAIDALADALARLRAAVAERDAAGFGAMLAEAKQRLGAA